MNTNTTRPSSTGGTIEYTATGLIHRAGRQYTGSAVQADDDEPAVKGAVERKAKRKSDKFAG